MKSRETISVESQPVKGFTLIELLVVIAVMAVLISLQIPAFAHATRQSLQAQCASNLRQFALASHIYAGENKDRLPVSSAGFWPWDLDTGPSAGIVTYGAPRQVLYCPAAPDQNVDGLWNFGGGWRVIGYTMSFMTSGSLASTNINTLLTPQR